MNLEDQVTSLEISMKLKELGFNIDSYFFNLKLRNCNPQDEIYNRSENLYINSKNNHIVCFNHNPESNLEDSLSDDYMIISECTWLEKIRRYTASELLEALPKIINEDDSWNDCEFLFQTSLTIRLIHQEIENCFMCMVFYSSTTKINHVIPRCFDINLANSLGKMLIYLIENNFMEVPK